MDDLAWRAHANFLGINLARNQRGQRGVPRAWVFAAAGATDFPSSRSSRLHDLDDSVDAAMAGHKFLMQHGNTALTHAQVTPLRNSARFDCL